MVAKILEKVTDTTTPNQSEDTTFKFVELLSLLTAINRIDISSTAILSDNCSEYTRKLTLSKITLYISFKNLLKTSLCVVWVQIIESVTQSPKKR